MSDAENVENLWAYRKRLRFVRNILADAFPSHGPSSLRVLDIGCGNGSQLSLPLARDGYQLTGLDPDTASIAHAKLLAGDVPNARFLCTSIELLPEETFDLVILSEVLEHVSHPQQLLRVAVGRLKPSAVLIVTTPNGYGEFEIDSWLFRTLRLERLVNALAKNSDKPLGSTDNESSGHIQFFTRRRLHRIFDECGLRVWSESASGLFGGPFAGHTLARSRRFIEWNARITDTLPLAVASGWYFALRRESEVGVTK